MLEKREVSDYYFVTEEAVREGGDIQFALYGDEQKKAELRNFVRLVGVIPMARKVTLLRYLFGNADSKGETLSAL